MQLLINSFSRFFTIHGSADKIIPVEDAYEFARLIPNHKLHVIKRANHGYTSHRKQLCDAIINCITSEVQRNCNSPVTPLVISASAICLTTCYFFVQAGNAPPQSRAEQPPHYILPDLPFVPQLPLTDWLLGQFFSRTSPRYCWAWKWHRPWRTLEVSESRKKAKFRCGNQWRTRIPTPSQTVR